MDLVKIKENLQNKRKAQVFKGGGPELSKVVKDCERFSDQTHTIGVFTGSDDECFNNLYERNQILFRWAAKILSHS